MVSLNLSSNSPKILSGIVVRDERIIELTKKFQLIKPTPEIAIIQVGNRADSSAYIKAKMDFANKVGVRVQLIKLSDSADESEVIRKIKESSINPIVRGVIIQLPLPVSMDNDKVVDSIDPRKDFDGLTSTNKRLFGENSDKAAIPATARGVMELLKFYKISLKNKKVTVVGRSALVGKPIAQLCVNAGAIVNVAHSKTVDLVKETKDADIIIVAVGKKNLIKAENVKVGQIIIDVGINRNDQLEIGSKKMVGDVDFESVSKVIGPTGAISPVPGGVGPMTVLCLFENLADLCL